MAFTAVKRPAFERSLESKQFYERLSEVNPGQRITYGQLSELMGKKITGGYPHLQHALKTLEREGVIFANVRGEGYERLDDVGIVDTFEMERLHIRRKATRVMNRLTSVRDFNSLPNEKKVAHNAAVSGLSAISSMLHPRKMRNLEQAVEKAQHHLSLTKTLAAFTNKGTED